LRNSSATKKRIQPRPGRKLGRGEDVEPRGDGGGVVTVFRTLLTW